MKDDRVCQYCTYKNVPTKFVPCLGCNGNLDKMIYNKSSKKTNIIKVNEEEVKINI